MFVRTSLQARPFYYASLWCTQHFHLWLKWWLWAKMHPHGIDGFSAVLGVTVSWKWSDEVAERGSVSSIFTHCYHSWGEHPFLWKDAVFNSLRGRLTLGEQISVTISISTICFHHITQPNVCCQIQMFSHTSSFNLCYIQPSNRERWFTYNSWVWRSGFWICFNVSTQ